MVLVSELGNFSSMILHTVGTLVRVYLDFSNTAGDEKENLITLHSSRSEPRYCKVAIKDDKKFKLFFYSPFPFSHISPP